MAKPTTHAQLRTRFESAIQDLDEIQSAARVELQSGAVAGATPEKIAVADQIGAAAKRALLELRDARVSRVLHKLG